MSQAFLKTCPFRAELENPVTSKIDVSPRNVSGRDLGSNRLPCTYTALVNPDLKMIQKAGPQQFLQTEQLYETELKRKKEGGRKKGEVAHQKATESVVGELHLQAPRAPDSFPSHESQGSQASELCILIESNLWNFPSRSAILVLARGRVLR